MIELLKDEKDCCGCGACAATCPHEAITMTEDASGYAYPRVDAARCTDCGACVRACRFTSSEKRLPQAVYAAQWQHPDLRRSASGGLFAALAMQTLAEGGLVVGCRMLPEDEWHPRLCCVETPEGLADLQGSKYVWSSTADVYRQVRQVLREGRRVLFSGLPCQVAGLKGFLRRDYEGLTTVDIICHGAPPPRIFAAYVECLGKRRHGRMHDFKFRVKEKGWGLYYYYYYWQAGKLKECCHPYTKSVFYRLFLSGAFYRPSCYACPFAGRGRASDLTIGDCWGIGREHPEFSREKGGRLRLADGVSCVLVNTPAGRAFFEAACRRQGVVAEAVDYECVARYNQQLNHPSPLPAARAAYLRAFARGGWKGVERTFFRKEWWHLAKELAKTLLLKLHVVKA